MDPDRIFDLNALLSMLEGESPVGVNLRDVAQPANRALYDSIRGARQSARKQEMANTDPANASARPEEWNLVFKNCVEAISHKSKDLEVATYLMESAVRVHGFAGLRDSAALYSGLVENYWDALYPPLDDDGSPSPRLAPLGALNGDPQKEGSLRFALARVPLTTGNERKFGLFHHECGVSIETLKPEQQEARLKSGWVSLAMFQESGNKTPLAFLQATHESLEQCNAELDRLENVLRNRCGADAPPIAQIRLAVESCQNIVDGFISSKIPAGVEAENPAGESSAAGAPESSGGVRAIDGSFRNRDEAFAVVMRIADFFRRTEPQSPVIFALEQAVRWGKMPLPELLTELIADEMVRRQLFERVGIRQEIPPQM